MDIQSLKTLMEINAMQTLGSLQSSPSNSNNSSLFSELLGEVLHVNEDSSSLYNESSLIYSGNSPVFIPSNINFQNGSFTNAITSFSSKTGLSSNYDEIIQRASEKFNLPEKLISSVIKQESGFNASAISTAGASGLMQIMPGTAKYLGINNIFDPEENIMGGAKYLRQMLNQFDGNIETALAAYNAGPGAVKKYDGIPPYKETQDYVRKVMNYFQA
ncbi:lytic transglycosylase domain-containing protein [Psychrobacillus vulpis]|uniref:Lytic transglycosylase domain-containing protein n=1 Tax=Psychrobacillus vulpis TaxID=2325572 RepID=A0A544TRY4_9BACI|nr:lytic transglycosylase domain-containing protein [Psychrobacillus vulpis]TQR20213.1 lytic transglycosylase domain-containing protein [Psychrobacillus vulpis]